MSSCTGVRGKGRSVPGGEQMKASRMGGGVGLIAPCVLAAAPMGARAEPPDAESVVSLSYVRAEALMDAQSREQALAAEPSYPQVKVWGFLQFRYDFDHREDSPDGNDNAEGFQTARTRLFIDSKITEDISTRIRFTFNRATGNPSLDQAYGDFKLGDDFKLRVGQFGLPLFRDEYISAEKQLAVNSSPTDVVFNQGQSQGIQLSHQGTSLRYWLAFDDGLRSGNTDFTDPRQANFAFTTRVEWMFAGNDWTRFDDYTSFPGSTFAAMVGLAFHTEQESQLVTGQVADQLYYITTDLGLEGDGWNAFLAGVFTWVDGSETGWITASGLIVQGGFFVSKQAEIFARYDLVIADRDQPDLNNFGTITAGFNYYFIPDSHAIKFTANALWFMDKQATSLMPEDTLVDVLSSSKKGQWAIQAQMQFIF